MAIDLGHRIGTYDYRITAEAISESYDLGQQALGPLICVFNTLQSTAVNPQQRHRTELEGFLRDTYAHIVFSHLDNQQTTYSAIRALNDHVLDKYGSLYGYADMDDFLRGQFLEVPLTYAILSEQAGYTITVIGDSRARMKDIHLLMKDIHLPFEKIGWKNV